MAARPTLAAGTKGVVTFTWSRRSSGRCATDGGGTEGKNGYEAVRVLGCGGDQCRRRQRWQARARMRCAVQAEAAAAGAGSGAAATGAGGGSGGRRGFGCGARCRRRQRRQARARARCAVQAEAAAAGAGSGTAATGEGGGAWKWWGPPRPAVDRPSHVGSVASAGAVGLEPD